MHRWRIDPHRLAELRFSARLTPEEMAAAAECHSQHYRKLERATPDGSATAEPGAELTWRILDILSDRLGRPVDISDIARRATRNSPARDSSAA